MKTLKALVLVGALAVAGSAMAQDYNRVAISYDNTRYSAGGDSKELSFGPDDNKSIATNGFGLNYIHGFSLSKSLPMFLEVGGNINFNFYGDSEREKGDDFDYRYQFQNINLQIPVNFTWRFNIVDDFTIAPYVGINFKFNFMQRGRAWYDFTPEDDEDQKWLDDSKKWTNFMSDKEDGGMGDKDSTWNMFQMGWHIGVNFQYTNWVLGVQYGTDFIPAYSYTYKEAGEKDWKSRINTANLKLSVGYCF